MKRFAVICSLLVFGAAPSARADDPRADAVIVERAPGSGADTRAALRDRAGVRAAGRIPGLPAVDVVVPVDGDQERALAALRADPAVIRAEPVVPRHALVDDAQRPSLWGLENTGQAVGGIFGTPGADSGAVRAWPLSRGTGVTIAVVDTGADLAHPDLAPQIAVNPGESGGSRAANGLDDDGNGFADDWRGWDFVTRDGLPADQHWHGTHVAGTAAAAAGGGDVIGVAPEARVLVLRALGASGSGYTDDTTAAFAYAGARGVRIVNASFGSDSPDRFERAAIRAYPNTLFVVAAGNERTDNDGAVKTYPCAYDEPNVLCVGASTQGDAPAAFSNFGAAAVDLFAPGVNILSSTPRNGYALHSGTSMASPFAAGAAALVASAQPQWKAGQIKQALLAGAVPLPAMAGLAVTGGRLDAAAALATAPPAEPEPTPQPQPVPQPAATPMPPPALQPAAAPVPLMVERLRVTGRRPTTVTLTFTASRAGRAALALERRRRGRYAHAGRGTLSVSAGHQRVALRGRVAGIRLRPGRWRLTLAGARVPFRLR